MFSLLLLSGAAFVAAAAVLGAQARVIDAGLPIRRAALVLLAAFAAAHGASDWAEMSSLVVAREGGPGGAEALATLHVALLAAAYTLLVGFALALPARNGRRSSAAPALAVAALAVWGVALGALLSAAHAAGVASSLAAVEVLTRWLVALPASVCAAAGLRLLARTLELESWVEARLVRWAGAAFVLHGLADALGALPGVLHAVWPAAAGALARHLSLGCALAETGSAAAIAILVSEAFVFQTTQRLRREETHLRDDFIALVAHELGNPVVALDLATARLEAIRAAGRPLDARLSGDLRACASTLRRIVADLVDTSRIQALELETTPIALELRPVLDRAAEVASAHAPERPRVAVACPDALPPALADRARVEQILGNLLSNAAKYGAPGSPVAVAAERGAGRITVRVLNEGEAIDPDEAARIFSRHYRTHAAVRGAARGLGLGLYVARALVEAQGGRIWVERDGGRTAFCFTLPTAETVQAAALAREGAPAAS